MDLRFDGKAVLVTGASTGIGAATAVAFAQAGARVGVHYFSSADAAKGVLADVKKAGSDGVLIQADLSEPAGAAKVVQEFLAFGAGRLDVLVNNAGSLLQRSPLEETSLELWRKIYALNVESVFLMCKAAIGPLRKARGAIVNVGSIAAYTGGGGGSAHYASAKAAVHCLTIGLAKEFGPEVRVNNVAPGVIDTPFHQKFSTREFVEDRTRQMTALKRPGVAADIVGAILFLASDAAGYLTGETISPNGGMVWRL